MSYNSHLTFPLSSAMIPYKQTFTHIFYKGGIIMACFMVPATEAIVTTVMTKVVEKKEKKAMEKDPQQIFAGESTHVSFSHKMKWLDRMLWGGSALLAFEHLWHGELSPVFPFLTAANSEAGLNAMFQEMATTGVGMAVLVTLVWGGMVAVTRYWEKHPLGKKVLQKTSGHGREGK